jgi:hypothetical protein
MNLAQIENYIALAKVTMFLSANENWRNKALNGGEYAGDKQIPFLLYVFAQAATWAKDYYAETPELDNVANYMFALCSRYATEASKLNATVAFTPVNAAVETPEGKSKYGKVQFVIGRANEFMSEGDSQLIIADEDGIVKDSAFVRVDGSGIPEDIDDMFSYTATYSAKQLVITFNATAELNQVYKVSYEKSFS